MSEYAEIQRALGRIEATQTAMHEDIRDVKFESKDRHERLEKRVRSLEGWRWYVLGAVATVGALASCAFAFL